MILFASLLLFQPAEAPASAIAAPAPAAASTPSPPRSPEASAPLAAEDLDAMRGGDGGQTAVITDQTLTAINAGNTLNAQTIGSGAINLGEGAFAGFAGIGNFAVNTGHNNNLQANVSISIVVTPSVGP
jgi:hypothetical protein